MLLLIDFSKAFDMVDHDILLQKLQHYGIRGNAINWVKSYLNNRMQFVSIDGKNSMTKTLTYGVPQGSILGPLFFIVYINDIPEIHAFAKFILYADDANIILTANSLAEIISQFITLSSALKAWVASNGLALNLKKTNYMIFTNQRRINGIDSFDLKICNRSIERKSVARFLGVLIDEKLKWSHHISAIKSKMARYVGIFYKIKSQLPLTSRLNLFQAHVQSHLNYCSLIWGFSCKSNIESIFTTQKKAMRAVMPGYVNYFYKNGVAPTHSKHAFSNYAVPTVHNIITKNALLFVLKTFKFGSNLPHSIRQLIPENAPTPGSMHDDQLTAVWMDNYNTTHFRASIFYKGPLFYSEIMGFLKPDNKSFQSYKTAIKTYLNKLQASGDADEWMTENFKLYNPKGLRQSKRIN